MASEYCRSVLRISVAQICQNLGWNSTQTTPLELLTDVLERYVFELGNVSHRYCEQFGRTEVNLDDVGLAFQQMSVSLEELTEYINHVEPIPFAKETVAFPAPKRNNLQFSNPRSREILQHREEHVPAYLPHMFPGGKDDIDEHLPSEVVGLTPEITSQIDASPTPTDCKLTASSSEGPPSKRLRVSNATLPPEADPSQYEMMSVEMTHEGELTPKRQGKLPDNRTPPAGFRQSLFRDVQSSPSDHIREKFKEKYQEGEKERSDVDVVDDSDNKSNNNSSMLSGKGMKIEKKFKVKSKLHKDGLKKKNVDCKVGVGNLVDKKKSKKMLKDSKLIQKKKANKVHKAAKEVKKETHLTSEDLFTANIQKLRDPDQESLKSQGNSPERLVIASDADVKNKEKFARLAAVDDCIDAVIRQSAAEVSEMKKDQDFVKPNQETLDSFDETINSVVRQSSEDNDSSCIDMKIETESDQKSSLIGPPQSEKEQNLKKKRKLKDVKSKSTKDKGVRDKLKKKLISKSLSTIAKKVDIPALPEKYLTDEMKVFAFDDSPEHPGVEVKEETIELMPEEAVALDLSFASKVKTDKSPQPQIPKPKVNKDEEIKNSVLEEAFPTPISNNLVTESKKEEIKPPSVKINNQPVEDIDGDKKIKHKSKEHKKDKKDKKDRDRDKYRDKDKKKKKKKDKDREKPTEKEDRDKTKEKKKEKSKSDKSDKKHKEPREEPPSKQPFPRLKLNIKLGGTPISSTSVMNSPSRLVTDVVRSPKMESLSSRSEILLSSPSRPEIPKLVIKPFSKPADEQKSKDKEKEEKQKLKKEEKLKLKEEKRLKEEREVQRQKEIDRQKEKEKERQKARERELEVERKKKEEIEKENERLKQKEMAVKQRELELKLKKEEEQKKVLVKKKIDDEAKERQRKLQKGREKLAQGAKIAKAANLLKKQLLEPFQSKEAVVNYPRSPTPPTVPASPATSNDSSPTQSPVRTPRLLSPSSSPKVQSKQSPVSPVKTPSRGRGRPPKNRNSPKVSKTSPRRFSPRTKSPESPNRNVKSGPVSPVSDDVALGSSSGVVAETVGTFLDAAGNQVWICPACKMQDDGSPMIGCDECPDWYHWVCVNIVQEPPEDDEWFCPRCRQNKKEKPKVKKKKKKKV